MKFEAVTIKDIAKALGLSTSTVSRALRDSYEISEETKQLVLKYAKELNYRPNPSALGLKEKRTRSIGIVISEIANSFFSQAINGIESVANQRGYNVIITQTLESYQREVANIQFLSSRSVDGCLISVSTETNDFYHISELYQKGFPIVCFDRVVDSLDTHKVTSDNFTGAYDATTHLIKSGYKKIAMLSSIEYLSISKERINGFKKALADHNIPFNEDYLKYCAHGGLDYQEVDKAMNELMKLKVKPDAIFTSGDKLTTNFMRYCKAKKIAIPEKIAVIGFSNLETTELMSPSLSVVRQPAFEMGRVATDLLLNMIESKRAVTDFEHIVLPDEIIVRDSSAGNK